MSFQYKVFCALSLVLKGLTGFGLDFESTNSRPEYSCCEASSFPEGDACYHTAELGGQISHRENDTMMHLKTITWRCEAHLELDNEVENFIYFNFFLVSQPRSWETQGPY